MSEKLTGQQKVYAAITAQIIKGHEKGQMIWQKPWTNHGGLNGFCSRAINVSSNKPYTGINALILDSIDLDVPVWGTFKQWTAKGCSIKKGEKGTATLFGSMIIYHNNVLISVEQYNSLSDEQRKICQKRYVRRYDNLFNIEQVTCTNAMYQKFAAKFDADKKIEPKKFDHEAADKLISDCEIPFEFIAGDKACYYPALDRIRMPLAAQFKTMEGYYSTFFHEIGHATGHTTRLNRKGVNDLGARFGSDVYSFEELVAELTQCFVNGTLGIVIDYDNTQAYINGWCKKLGENPKWIVDAASQAVKAANWILSHLPKDENMEVGQIDVDEMEPEMELA